MNSVGQIPFALIQAVGRPDLSAKVHIVELPLYLLALWGALELWGLEGVAAVWFLRALLDSVGHVRDLPPAGLPATPGRTGRRGHRRGAALRSPPRL